MTGMWSKETGFDCRLERVVSDGRYTVEGNWVQLWAGRVDSTDKNEVSGETGSSCWVVYQQWRQEHSWRKTGSAAGWKGWSCCGLESSSVSAGTVLEIGIGCSCEQSLQRTGSAVSLTHVHFRKDENHEWMRLLQARCVRDGLWAGTWLPYR